MPCTPAPELAVRAGHGPDHHLWNNHGTWWLHASLRDGPHLKARRFRVSLGTRCLLTARARRDAWLARLHAGLDTGLAAGGRAA